MIMIPLCARKVHLLHNGSPLYAEKGNGSFVSTLR